jgi:hypothetical protein
LGLAPGASGAVADEHKARAAVEKARAGVDLSGRWLLNAAESDDAREKMRESMERGGGPGMGGSGGGPGMGGPGMGGAGMGGAGMGGMGGGRGGRMGPPPAAESEEDRRAAMRAIFDPAPELQIYQGEPEVVIVEKDARRRNLHADGRKYKADGGASEVKTQWKDGRLVVQTQGLRGRRTIETWALTNGGKRLTATTKVEGGFGSGVTLKRVYDRASEPASNGADDAGGTVRPRQP